MSLAHQLALDAAEVERQVKEERQAEKQRERDAAEKERLSEIDRTFRIGTNLLRQWLPGTSWRIYDARLNGYDMPGRHVVVMEKGADSSDPLKLMLNLSGVQRDRVTVRFVTHTYDRSISDHYWGGGEVKSAADIGRCLLRF